MKGQQVQGTVALGLDEKASQNNWDSTAFSSAQWSLTTCSDGWGGNPTGKLNFKLTQKYFWHETCGPIY
jgi:hypothetical protein